MDLGRQEAKGFSEDKKPFMVQVTYEEVVIRTMGTLRTIEEGWWARQEETQRVPSCIWAVVVWRSDEPGM